MRFDVGVVIAGLGAAVGGGIVYGIVLVVGAVLDLDDRTDWVRDLQGALTTLAALGVGGGVFAGCWGALRAGRRAAAGTTALVAVAATAAVVFVLAAVGDGEPGLVGVVIAALVGGAGARLLVVRDVKART